MIILKTTGILLCEFRPSQLRNRPTVDLKSLFNDYLKSKIVKIGQVMNSGEAVQNMSFLFVFFFLRD